MKKISLKNLNLNEVEQLSREQLKIVLGGNTVLSVGAEDVPEVEKLAAQLVTCSAFNSATHETVFASSSSNDALGMEYLENWFYFYQAAGASPTFSSSTLYYT